MYVYTCLVAILNSKTPSPTGKQNNINVIFHYKSFDSKTPYTVYRASTCLHIGRHAHLLLLLNLCSPSSSLSELMVIILGVGLGVSAITIICFCSLPDGRVFRLSAHSCRRELSSETRVSGGVFSFTLFFTGDKCVEVAPFL